jgi:hypothetical protein
MNPTSPNERLLDKFQQELEKLLAAARGASTEGLLS